MRFRVFPFFQNTVTKFLSGLDSTASMNNDADVRNNEKLTRVDIVVSFVEVSGAYESPVFR